MEVRLLDADSKQHIKSNNRPFLSVEACDGERVEVVLGQPFDRYSTVKFSLDKNGTVITLENGDEIFIRTTGSIHYMPAEKPLRVSGSVETRSSPGR